MARKQSKGKKPAETMRQRQQRLLKEQRARKAAASKPVKARSSSPTSQRVEKVKVKVEPQKSLPPSKKSLPAGKKGGALASTKGPRRTNINGNPSNGTQLGTKGSAKAQLRLPKGTIRSAGAASKALSTTGKVAGRIALPLAAYQTAKDLKDSLDRGEGYARLPGMIGRALKGNGKNKKSTGAKTNSRGRRVGPAAAPTKTPKTPKKNNTAEVNARVKAQSGEQNRRAAAARAAAKDPKPKPKPTPTPTLTRKPTPTVKKPTPTVKKPTYNKPSTTKGPTKSGGYIASKKSSTTKGPTADGKHYDNHIKSKRLRDALNNLKVRKYKK